MDERLSIANNIKKYEKQLEEHQKSSDCTHKPDCPKCVQLKGWIEAEKAALNEFWRI